jgi:hypothetical protein
MPPLAPTITQAPPTNDPPLGVGEIAANVAKQPGDPDTDTATFTKTADPGSAFTLTGSILYAAKELDGAFSVTITATTPGGTSPPTTATLTFAENDNPWDDTDHGYPGNPQIPPVLPPDQSASAWPVFLVPATNAIVPRARNGVDFVVARTAKDQPPESVYWNATLLGARPDTAIENEAKRLLSQWPSNVRPI